MVVKPRRIAVKPRVAGTPADVMRVPLVSDDPQRPLEIEWLLTNGIGGFAMGTALGVNTRRYHGLLIAALRPPVRRILILHSLIEQLDIGDESIDLSTQCFGENDLLHPRGWRLLREFRQLSTTSVCWTYQSPDFMLERTLELVAGRNAAQITYRIETDAAATLYVRPLIPLRDMHNLDERDAGLLQVEKSDDPFRVDIVRDHQRCELSAAAAQIDGDDPQVWRDFAYPRDRERGQSWREHVPGPVVMRWEIPSGRSHKCTLCISVPSEVVRVGWRHGKRSSTRGRGRLEAAASQFIVLRRNSATATAAWSTSVIAGYPWFADWGRDAMIALPGLLLGAKRYDEAWSLLHTFAAHERNGLIPNRFDDYTQAAHYNTADASLWFINAVYQTQCASGYSPPQDLRETCARIIDAYQNGTDFDIFMDDDGLIAAGNPTTQLTWMDAQRDGITFTPRHGKAVEVNALWHNALLCAAAMLQTDDPVRATRYRTLAKMCADSFQELFWWPQRNCLHDVLTPCEDGWRRDGRLRPNQIFAVSLPHSPLTVEQQRRVVDVVQQRLLTPYGLRTLDRDDPEYRGRFEGDMLQRDAAYHQGSAWPWLIGAFCQAYRRVHTAAKNVTNNDDTSATIAGFIAPLLAELDRGCLGQIAEIYDGDPPHRAHGCIAQAWSVAALLEATAPQAATKAQP